MAVPEYHLNVFLGDRMQLDLVEIYGEGSVSSLSGVSIHPQGHGQLAVGYSFHVAGQGLAEESALYLVKHWKAFDGELVLVEDY